MELAPGRVIDRYVVDGPIGRGGMATVFRARHTALGTRHALKVLHSTSPSVRARLLQEGRVQANLRHPCVVSVSDVIDVDGSPGLVMEFVHGPSLDRWLAVERPTLAQIDALALDILDGVAAAHKVGLVHRDLKPGNVMVCVHDGRVRAKITDFGLAKVLASDAAGAIHTRSGASLGTPAYMAPEQIRDAGAVDARADVYALGALLYELACGRRAFDGDDMLDIFDRIRRGAYTAPAVVRSDLPARMSAAIDGALKVDPDERWPDVPRLRDAWTDGDAIVVDPGAFPPALVDRTLALAPPLIDSVDDVAATFLTSVAPTSAGTPIALPSAGTSRAPPPASSRAPVVGGVALLVLIALIAVGTWAALTWTKRPDVAGLDGVPALPGASAAMDQAWQEGWNAFLGTEFTVARRRFERVGTEVDDARVWGALAVTCSFMDEEECVQDAVERAAASPGPEGAEIAALAKVASTSTEDPAPWVAYLDRHPDDLLIAVGVQNVVTADLHARLDRFAGPDAPPIVPYVRARAQFHQQIPASEARAIIDAGLARHPDVPELHGMRGLIELESGRYAVSRDAFRAALDAEPGLTWIWPGYGVAAHLAGDTDAAARITAQATAPEQPLASRLAYWRQLAVMESGRGHLADALHLLDEADAAAVSADAWSSVLDLRLARLRYVMRFEMPATDALEAFREAASAPEVPTQYREQTQQDLVALEGELDALRGDVASAALARDRAARIGASAEHLRALDRAVAVANHDLAGVVATDVPDADASCRAPLQNGLARARAGFLDDAVPLLRRGLAPELWCPTWGTPNALRVYADVALAEWHLQRGERDAARDALADAQARWPDPDADLAVMTRLAAARSTADSPAP